MFEGQSSYTTCMGFFGLLLTVRNRYNRLPGLLDNCKCFCRIIRPGLHLEQSLAGVLGVVERFLSHSAVK